MKNLFKFFLTLFLLSNAHCLVAQEYSDYYVEVRRLWKKKDIEVKSPYVFVVKSDKEIKWLSRGGMSYEGKLDKNNILHFSNIKFKYKNPGKEPNTIELKNGKTTHILQRQKIYEDVQLNITESVLPDDIAAEEFDIHLVKNKDWKVFKRLDKNGKIYSGESNELIYEVKTERGFIVFYTMENPKEPIYKMNTSLRNELILEDSKGNAVTYYAYYVSKEEWILSDKEKTIYYYLRKVSR